MRLNCVLSVSLLLLSVAAQAQQVIDDHERLRLDRPEAWAMAYLAATTRFGGVGVAEDARPGQWSLALELGHVPHLSERQRRVGFDGTKLEDLNKSPLFGRLRIALALPADFTVEAGWTPPVEIDGARPQAVWGIAVQRPLWSSTRWRFGARGAQQRGRVHGDITCDADTAAQPLGSDGNPYGCRAPSDDRFRWRLDTLELQAGWQLSPRWQPYASWSISRLRADTRNDARVFSVIDRSRLSTRGTLHGATLGLRHQRAQWQTLLALQWTPLDVRRAGRPAQSDDLWSLRLLLRRQFD